MLSMRPQEAFVFSLVTVERSYDILDDGKPVAVVGYLKNKGARSRSTGARGIRSGVPVDQATRCSVSY